ncbi:MAG: sulfurtransferase [Burkholderiales bacterium]|nr:sulfurtransferase [Burkholderiales bacterium]
MKTLICASDLLAATRGVNPPVLLDCSFDLTDAEAGERAWRQGHLPRSQYVHLDRDLAGDKHDLSGRFLGRHPLPERGAFSQRLGRLGITPSSAVVCCDGQGGPYASRAWWLLRWMGHADVAVLDGGVAAWREAGGELVADVTAPQAAAPYPSQAPALPTIDADTLLFRLGRGLLIDARAGERFRGEIEPLDPAAGHIPGARQRFFKDNLASDGRFKSAAALRAEWQPLLAGHDAGQVVQQCGSGVTACHNLLALAHAGLGDSVLYPGSWSEWSADPRRPRAQG